MFGRLVNWLVGCNRPTNSLTNQPTDRATNWPADQPIDQPTTLPPNLPTCQSIDQSIDQWINSSIYPSIYLSIYIHLYTYIHFFFHSWFHCQQKHEKGKHIVPWKTLFHSLERQKCKTENDISVWKTWHNTTWTLIKLGSTFKNDVKIRNKNKLLLARLGNILNKRTQIIWICCLKQLFSFYWMKKPSMK